MKTFHVKTKILKKSLAELKEQKEETKKLETIIAPEFDFEDDLIVKKTPEQILSTLKEAEKKLKPVLIQNPREHLKRKLEQTKPTIEKEMKKIKQSTTSPKTPKETLKNKEKDIFDFDDEEEKTKKIKKKR